MSVQIRNSGSRRRSGSGRRIRSTRKPIMSEINVTPFVDVMLVLLIIFMVTAPLMATGIKVNLPETSSGTISGQNDPVIITIDKKGNFFISKKKITLKNMIKTLQAVKNIKPTSRIVIRGDRKVDYGSVMKVFGTLNEAGYTKVVLETTLPI